MARNPGFEAVKQTANPKPPATMFHGRLPRSKWRVLFLPNITFPICGQKAEFGFHLALQHPSSTLFFYFFFLPSWVLSSKSERGIDFCYSVFSLVPCYFESMGLFATTRPRMSVLSCHFRRGESCTWRQPQQGGSADPLKSILGFPKLLESSSLFLSKFGGENAHSSASWVFFLFSTCNLSV